MPADKLGRYLTSQLFVDHANEAIRDAVAQEEIENPRPHKPRIYASAPPPERDANGDDAFMRVVRYGTTDEISVFLAFFLYESPTSMIPSSHEVASWAEAFDARGPEFASSAAACREYVAS